MDPLPPELPPRAPLDEPDSRILLGGGASLVTPFAETPDATGQYEHSLNVLLLSNPYLYHSNRLIPVLGVFGGRGGGAPPQ